MNRLCLLIIALVFTLSLVKAQYPTQGSQVVTNINNLQRGWIVIGSSGVGLDSRWTIIDGGRYDKYDRVDVCYSIDDAVNWKKISYQESGCGNCSIAPPGGIARGACYKYEKQTPRTVGGSSSPSPSPSPQPSPQPAPNQNVIKRGSLNALLRIWDVKVASIYIKHIGSPSSDAPIYLGELFSSYGEPRINIMKGNITSNFKTKEFSVPVGKYTLVAIDKTNNNSNMKFERQIEIVENQHTYIDVDFDYSYLYYLIRFEVNKEPKNWKVSISIDGNPYKDNYSSSRGYSYYNFCEENKKYKIEPQEIMKPNIMHTMRVKYLDKNGELIEAEKKFTFGENECTQVDFVFGTINPNTKHPSEAPDLPPPPSGWGH